MKRILAALALAAVLLTVPAAAFSDVDGGLYYAAPIAWAVEQGITTGTTESTFSPDTLCTRGQIITFLWRAAGSPAPKTETSPFTDVTEALNPDFYKAILWAYETGITNGGSQFFPNLPCDRGTTMGFLWRYAGSPDASAPGAFTDVAPDADYAQAVAWAVEAGITDGTAETTFSPTESCTRGQIATFLYRCLNETGEKAEPEPIPEPSAPEPAEETPPLRTLTGTGAAHSLGLDGSEFTPDNVYEAKATVEVYSPQEAVFTIQVPFPLYQACVYTIRFEHPDQPGTGYIFSYYRWDEAFADLFPWNGDPQVYTFTDMSGNKPDAPFTLLHIGDDRSGGLVQWKISFQDLRPFNYDMLDGYILSCEVYSNL